MNILVCGPLESPFIYEDMLNLRNAYTVRSINTSPITLTIKGFLTYALFSYFEMPYEILKNDIIYIWFADYLAVPILLWSKLFFKKTILNVGGYEVSAIPEIGYGTQLKWFRGMVSRWCIRQASVVIVPSDSYEKKTLEAEPRANVRVVPNAIDTDKLCNIPISDKQPEVVTAVYNVTRDWNLKGIPTFWAASLGSKYKHQILYGKPHDELITELVRVKVYCQFSVTESCGVTVLEAMACGCVPVVSNVDDLPALVGDTGIVVPVGDYKQAKEAIEKALFMDGGPARERARKFGFARKLKAVQWVICQLSGIQPFQIRNG
jgi:glycosyltransferase involved in cell wall biosynthesis